MSIEHRIHSPDAPTDRAAMLDRRSVAAPENARDSAPRGDRGAMAVDAAALGLGGVELADLLLHATSLPSFGSIPGLAGSLIAILLAWYVAKKRSRFGYWLLVAIAGSMVATSLPPLLDATGLEAMLLASRAMAGALGIGLLWGPARRYGTREAGGGQSIGDST